MQSQLRKLVLEHAGNTAPTLQHQLGFIDKTDQERIYLDQVEIDDISVRR